MQRAGHEFLACSALTEDQHGGLLRGDTRDQRAQIADRGALADNPELIGCDLRLEERVLGFEQFEFDGAFERCRGEGDNVAEDINAIGAHHAHHALDLSSYVERTGCDLADVHDAFETGPFHGAFKRREVPVMRSLLQGAAG